MMRRHPCIPTLLQLLILVSLPLGASHAQSDPHQDTSPYAWSAHSVTREGRVRVTITKTKSKLRLVKSQQFKIQLRADDDDDYYDNSPDIYVGYRRPDLVDQTANAHDDISDEIKIRLLLARKRALEAHARKWA